MKMLLLLFQTKMTIKIQMAQYHQKVVQNLNLSNINFEKKKVKINCLYKIGVIKILILKNKL